MLDGHYIFQNTIILNIAFIEVQRFFFGEAKDERNSTLQLHV